MAVMHPRCVAAYFILLDVLFEENHYASLVEKEIQNELLITEGENLKVNIPSVNCILGDKLTAFAPHTTGILLNNGKDMEVLKQMYDVCTLIDAFDNYDEMIESYDQLVVQEIAYRGVDISKEDVLEIHLMLLCVLLQEVNSCQKSTQFL